MGWELGSLGNVCHASQQVNKKERSSAGHTLGKEGTGAHLSVPLERSVRVQTFQEWPELAKFRCRLPTFFTLHRSPSEPEAPFLSACPAIKFGDEKKTGNTAHRWSISVNAVVNAIATALATALAGRVVTTANE